MAGTSALLHTLSTNFGISTTSIVRRFFTLGPFSSSRCLTPFFQALFRGLPWFFAPVFPRFPVVRRLRFGHLCRFLFRPTTSWRQAPINRLFTKINIFLLLKFYLGEEAEVKCQTPTFLSRKSDCATVLGCSSRRSNA